MAAVFWLFFDGLCRENTLHQLQFKQDISKVINIALLLQSALWMEKVQLFLQCERIIWNQGLMRSLGALGNLAELLGVYEQYNKKQTTIMHDKKVNEKGKGRRQENEDWSDRYSGEKGGGDGRRISREKPPNLIHFRIPFSWSIDITSDRRNQPAVMTRTCAALGETQPLLSWQWIRAGPTGSTDFSVDIAGIKAIKIKLVGTLAIKRELDFD